MRSNQRPRPVNSVDRNAFRDMCRRFAAAEIEPRWRQADRERSIPRALFEAAAAAGLIGITANESVGGAALGSYEEAIAMEEMSRVDPDLAVALLVQNDAGSTPYEHGTPARREIARDVVHQFGRPIGANQSIAFWPWCA
jgi:alkylation response protein AidB-like acyl-CoA dehydrogenase